MIIINTKTIIFQVVVMCFAVFVGSWTPLHSNIGIFSNAGHSVVRRKSAVDYSTPSGNYKS